MRLFVYVLKAVGLPPSGGIAGAYAKLQVGKQKSRTQTVAPGADPGWSEEFVFSVEDEEEELEVAVCRGGEVVGRVQIPVWTVLDEGTQTLPPTWFSLHPDREDSTEVVPRDSGKILLTISLYGKINKELICHTSPSPSFRNSTSSGEVADTKIPPPDILLGKDTSSSTSMNKSLPEKFHSQYAHLDNRSVNKNEENFGDASANHGSCDLSEKSFENDSNMNSKSSEPTFEEAIGVLQSRKGSETNMPENLHGGILLDQTYQIDPKDMNSLLFEPNAQLRKDLAEQQGSTDYDEGPWTWGSKDKLCLRRSVTYTKAASKVVKAVKAIEEQTYLKADGKNFAVSVHVSTPDVLYGNCFQINLLYKIAPGPQLSSGEECSHLVISWNINFSQCTMMKGIIEGTVRQGLKESYENFADLLAQFVKPVNAPELLLEKERLLAPLQLGHQTHIELATDYFCNVTVFSAIFMGLYVLLHILLSGPRTTQGLEFIGLDLPDTIGELFTSGILVLQGERVLNMISHFIQARYQRGGDHGIKAQGDGWLLTVALIEASNLPSVVSSGISDPYVVFISNGQTRTSSVQLQTLDPQWSEILEFDAMLEPPSMLDIEVLDFDGPFDQAVSLGHAEVNFLKHTSAELADLWLPLEGKLAQTCQSKLHLRIFLENTKGVETIREYLTKMEKEVGKKLNPSSPQKTSTFQKLFGLPPEEFLINDFSCYLKRKIPLQGKLFLSTRIIGFYGNLFGHKTKFFFLWDDIDDIQIVSPSLSTVGSPALLIILKSGRGLEARHGAKTLDREGRLKFQFQAFVSFNVASRTIMALWRTRNTDYEQCAKLDEDQEDQCGKLDQAEDNESLLMTEDSALKKAFSSKIPVPNSTAPCMCLFLLVNTARVDLPYSQTGPIMRSLLRIFGGGELEKKIMEKAGCLNYSMSQWIAVKPNVKERHVQYKFSRHTSIFGGEVSTTQQRTRTPDGKGWIIDETMVLHNVPFGDHFNISLRYNFEEYALDSSMCQYAVFIGILWTRSTKFKKKISKNVLNKLCHRWKEIFEFGRE